MASIDWTTTEVLEVPVTVLFLVSFLFAMRIHSKYPKLSGKSWNVVCVGLFSLVLHGLFDFLDSFEWGDGSMAGDYLNIFDGIAFITGLTLIAIGIVAISKRGQKLWGNA